MFYIVWTPCNWRAGYIDNDIVLFISGFRAFVILTRLYVHNNVQYMGVGSQACLSQTQLMFVVASLATWMICLVCLLISTFNFTEILVIPGQESSLKTYARTGKMEVPVMSLDPSHLETLPPLQRLKRSWHASFLVIPVACWITKMRTSTFNITPRWVHIRLLTSNDVELISWCEHLVNLSINCMPCIQWSRENSTS